MNNLLNTVVNRLNELAIEESSSCINPYCSTCGGRAREIYPLIDQQTRLDLKLVFEQITIDDLGCFGPWTQLAINLERDAFARMLLRVAESTKNDLRSIDIFLNEARNWLDADTEFNELVISIALEAVQMAVNEKNASLIETLLLTLRPYLYPPELIKIAKEIALHDTQMQRVLYNRLRKDDEDVRNYVGPGRSPVPW